MSSRAAALWKYAPFLYRIHAGLRAWQQERHIDNEQADYAALRRLSMTDDPQNINDISARLQERLSRRGLVPRPKPKRALRIIYATRPSGWEPHNIPPELAKVGTLIPYYYAERGFDDTAGDWPDKRERLDRDLLAFVKRVHDSEPVDAFVGYLSGWQIAPATLLAIGRMGIVTVGFHWDDKRSFRGKRAGGRWSGPAAVAGAYDLNLTNAPDSIAKYQAEGGLALFWPEAANPDHFCPLDRAFEYDVSFVGACYGYRPIFMRELRRQGIAVEAFGPGWPNGPVSEKEMVEIYARSRINLGFGGIGYSMKAQCLKGRDFEVPMCGALYLTSDNPELRLVYNVGREIVTYGTKEECAGMIRHLLAHPEEARAIRRTGRARCLSEHTWEKRFESVFQLAGMLNGRAE